MDPEFLDHLLIQEHQWDHVDQGIRLDLVVQVNQHLPSVLALLVHLLLQAAHQDPEVQQNQQLQWGHSHHENQDCHESQVDQLNL